MKTTRAVGGLVLFKKEIREIFRTSRIYVIPGLFLFFGFLSPITAKMAPQLIKSISGPSGVQIILPPPAAGDAFVQFFKNLSQTGVLSVILMVMGSLAEEKNRGTAILVVTKPVSRTAMVWAKLAANSLLVTFATALAYVGALYYTMVLFPAVPVRESIFGTLALLVYLLFVAAMTIAASAVTRSQVAAGGLAIAGYFVISLLPVFGRFFARWTPGALVGLQTSLLSGKVSMLKDAVPPMAVAVALGLVLVALASAGFGKQEL